MRHLKTRSSAIADKLRALFCKVVEVLQNFLSEKRRQEVHNRLQCSI